MGQVSHQREVLATGEQVVDLRELTGDPDDPSHLVGPAGRVEAADADLAAVRVEQGRKDPHGGALASTVGAEQRDDAALADVEVDAVEDHVVRRRTREGRSSSARAERRVRHAPPCPLLPTAERRITTSRKPRTRRSTVSSNRLGSSYTASVF